MKYYAVLLGVLALGGCSSFSFFSDDTPPQLTVNISAERNINPNVDGLPSPVELRVYQLADSEAFNQADFIQLYNDEQGVLKAGLLSTRHLQSIMPSESRQEIIPANAETKYIGVIAAFANYREANNKAIYQPVAGSSSTIQISLDGVNLTLTGEED